MVAVYDLLFVLFALLYLPYLLIKGKWHKGFGQRFGFLRKDDLKLLEKKRMWIHAVSVGEVMLIKNLLTKIRVAYPGHQIVLSVVTQTGFQLAQSIAAQDDLVIYAPVDLSFAVRRYLDILKPSIYLNAETEIWPNLLTELSKRAVPIVQINGRISDQAFKGYKFFKALFKPVLNRVSFFCMQSAADAARVKELGVGDEEVFVVGNMKFDDDLESGRHLLAQAITSRKGLMLVAGSTHPGEEEIILDMVAKLKAQFPLLSLVVAPRHPERAQEVVNLCKAKGFAAVRFSQITETLENGVVIVVDTIGHLRSFYALADVVFLGKSLTVRGGHNIIEPAYYGKPVVVGPYMDNFRDITRLFLEKEAMLQIDDQAQLVDVIAKLLSDEKQRRSLGDRAKQVVLNNKGATEKTFAVIAKVMG